MCNKCDHAHHHEHPVDDVIDTDRRKILIGGAGLAAAAVITPLLGLATKTHAAEGTISPSALESVPAYGAASASSPIAPMQIKRRTPGPNDVVLDVLYCGICHSDIHQARDEWKSSGLPTLYSCVPGHEIIGRVIAVGRNVTKFKAGDIGGVGCMVDSCGECDNCLADREQNCLKATFTYNSPDPDLGGHTYGGYSGKIVVAEHFVIRIPPGVDLAATAPLLCAGITTFSPMQHWQLKPGQRVGVVGFGGLGHMAVKLGVARKADVTVFTTSPAKIADARKMGAKDVVLSTDAAAMKKHASQYDLLISAVPQAYLMQPFMDLLKLDATLVNVGALDTLQNISGFGLIYGRKSVAGSMIGGIAETQEMIDYCAARKIKADIELIKPSEINKAFDRVVKKDVRYRFVIDIKAT